MTTKRQTTEQRRAASAWNDIRQVPQGEQDEYQTRAKNLPAMIQINGLGTTMAFLLSKPKKPAYKRVYEHVSKWVTQEMEFKGDLMTFVRDAEMGQYRKATTEAIEYAIWLKRYVESWDI